MNPEVAQAVISVPDFGRQTGWQLAQSPSSPIEDWADFLDHIKKNPPPAMPDSGAIRALTIATFWVPLLKRLGLAPDFVAVWIIWFRYDVCSWKHLVDFIEWHIQTGLVPLPERSYATSTESTDAK